MPVRDDNHGPIQPPQSHIDFILRVGGKNPYGEPLYRLVWAENRYRPEGGIWHDWDENLTVQERGGLITDEQGRFRPSDKKPLRIVAEIRKVHKYMGAHGPLKGWIIERWQPAFMYGARDSWPKHPVTGQPILGPWPEFGDYEKVTDPAVHLPALSTIKNAIEKCEFNREYHKQSVEAAVREAVNEAEFRYEEKMRKEMEEAIAFFRDQLSPWNHISLSAGRWREELARRAGVREHAGN